MRRITAWRPLANTSTTDLSTKTRSLSGSSGLQLERAGLDALRPFGQARLGGVHLQLLLDRVVVDQRLLFAAGRAADLDAELLGVLGAHLEVQLEAVAADAFQRQFGVGRRP